MDGGQLVWAPDLEEGYQLGQIVDVGSDTLSVRPVTGPADKVVVASYDRVYPAVDEAVGDVEDNCSLMYLNEATLLHNLRVRYKKGHIYTYIANILLTVNPYYDFPDLFSEDTIHKYNGKSLGTLPPHIFAIADKAYREMKTLNTSQSIVVSGESGAGKTETTKYILRYLTESYGASSGIIEQRIVEANPLLESFGNAKTLRNRNSSRFGKFVEIHFDGQFQVVGGHVSHYLLEKSRVCSQQSGERSYHVFYHLLAGAPDDTRKALGLTQGTKFNYLNPDSLQDATLNDKEGYQTLEQSMDKIGLSGAEKADLFRVVATVLHLGNITFEENIKDKKGGSLISRDSQSNLAGVANMLGLEMPELQRALVSRVMTTTKGGAVGTIINVPLKPSQACRARDALAKALYVRLFDYIVKRVNQCFPFQSSSYYIGVLDIAGFEYYEMNSFEQFCINYCNEKLQQFFNARVLRDEQDLYQKEGLGLTEVRYTNNQDCIDLIEMKMCGIVDLLDEECKLPKGTHTHFTEAVHSKHKGHFRLSVPRKSKLSSHRNLLDNEGFLVRHFAGAVCYQTVDFVEKNNDALHASLEQLIELSKDNFIKTLFPEATRKSEVNTKKLALVSVSSKFRQQLKDLMEKLNATGASFIRCLKPNLTMEANVFVGGQILSQLQCAGMVEVLELMQGGFPSRTHFGHFYQMYKAVLPHKLARLDPKTFSEALFRAIGMGHAEFSFGASKVFFRSGKFAEFDQLMRSDPAHLLELISKVQRWLVCKTWRKAIYGAISVLKLSRKIQYRAHHAGVIQRNAKMYLAFKKHRPRYQGLARLSSIQSKMALLMTMASTIKRDTQQLKTRVSDLDSKISQSIQTIKTTFMSRADIDRMYDELFKQTEEFITELHSRQEQQRVEEEEAARMKQLRQEQEQERLRLAEEAAKLRRIQEELEREKRRKVEEEQRRIREEEDRRLRAELEERRQREEEERRKAEEEQRKKREQEEADMKLAKKIEEEKLALKLAAEEQERRDYELAMRLAQSQGRPQDVIAESLKGSEQPESQIAQQSLKSSTSHLTQEQQDIRKKYNLNTWKYAELRDTINTSVDIDLLEACREEFHRRLRVYHAWKARNKKKMATQQTAAVASPSAQPAQPQRAPESVLSAAESQPPPIPPRESSAKASSMNVKRNDSHRFFRVPFASPSSKDKLNRKKGWWYAHFNGQWVVRQLELHPDKVPLLLVAGKDDLEMCELSLDETGLALKRGAEILEHEFEEAWSRHGGQPYVASPGATAKKN